MLWRCRAGHEWWALPNNITVRKWCPDCAGSSRLTIEQMQALAQAKDGKCLSKEYVNNSTAVIWQCSKGHEWPAIPTNIKRGSWCPECAGRKKKTLSKPWLEAASPWLDTSNYN